MKLCTKLHDKALFGENQEIFSSMPI